MIRTDPDPRMMMTITVMMMMTVQVMRKADEQLYALKRVDLSGLESKDIANALNELRILASFQHPRILRFYEAFIGK
jgi:serine/threonine protein kinase